MLKEESKYVSTYLLCLLALDAPLFFTCAPCWQNFSDCALSEIAADTGSTEIGSAITAMRALCALRTLVLLACAQPCARLDR